MPNIILGVERPAWPSMWCCSYVVLLIEITDPAGMAEYRQAVGDVLTRYGGHFLAAAPPEVSEGDLRPHVGVIEFPSAEHARTFYNAAEYQDLKALRQRSTRSISMLLDGLPTQ